MNNTSMPSLRIPSKSKTKEWVKSIALYASNNVSLYSNDSVRATIRDKIVNTDLYNGVIHIEDFVHLVNPMSLSTISSTRELQHYPIAAPMIDLQVGEMINRPFEPMVSITNNVAIEDKKSRLREYVQKEMAAAESNFTGDEEALKAELERIQKKVKYTYKDVVEKKSTALLMHYMQELHIKDEIIEAYRRMFNTGDQLYEIDVVNNEPTFRAVNTLKLGTVGGNSSKIHESDIITLEDHFSPGYLIDRYGSMLKDDEVERIISHQTESMGGTKAYGDVTHEFVSKSGVSGEFMGQELSRNYVDPNGNIRHMRIRFKAYKQLKKIAYQDPSTGEQQQKTVSESYRLTEGEKLLDKIWIYDWWIVTLIGGDIIVDAHPIPIRLNRLSSLIEGHCGLVGRTFNINERRAVAPMTRMRPYQYLYDVIMDNIIVAMSKNIGPILEMDLAKRPAAWTTTKWLGFISKYNVKFIDNAKEIGKGNAKGTMAGNMNTGRDQVTNLDFGNYIQQLIGLAEYLQKATGDIIGITPQRLGAIHHRETAHGVERSTSQSSHITEWINSTHESNTLEALNVFIEAAKFALKDNPKKLQKIVDGITRDILDVTEEDLSNADLGVFASNSTKAKENKNTIDQAAHAYMQNGGDFSFVFDVLFSDSMSEKRRMIEDKEDEAKVAAQEERADKKEEFSKTLEKAEKVEQAKTDLEQEKLKLEKYKADLDAKIKLKVEEAKLAIASGKISADKDQTMEELKLSIQTLQLDMDKEYNRSREKAAELGIKAKEAQNKAQISKSPEK